MDKTRYRVYICGGPRCLFRGSAALQHQLGRELWKHELEAAVEVIVSGCQDRCDDGPNMTVWPGPHRYAGLTSAALSQVVAEHLRDDTPVQRLLGAEGRMTDDG